MTFDVFSPHLAWNCKWIAYQLPEDRRPCRAIRIRWQRTAACSTENVDAISYVEANHQLGKVFSDAETDVTEMCNPDIVLLVGEVLPEIAVKGAKGPMDKDTITKSGLGRSRFSPSIHSIIPHSAESFVVVAKATSHQSQLYRLVDKDESGLCRLLILPNPRQLESEVKWLDRFFFYPEWVEDVNGGWRRSLKSFRGKIRHFAKNRMELCKPIIPPEADQAQVEPAELLFLPNIPASALQRIERLSHAYEVTRREKFVDMMVMEYHAAVKLYGFPDDVEKLLQDLFGHGDFTLKQAVMTAQAIQVPLPLIISVPCNRSLTGQRE
jgi:hypothetical protein